jgi:hypothetical protein
MKTRHRMRRDHPVWVWDGFWMAAIVAEVMAKHNDESLIVRFESGVTAPALWENIKPRDPECQGRDKPRHHAVGRSPG